MDIIEALRVAGIACSTSACCSAVEYVCKNTTPEDVDVVLKSIGVYGDLRAYWSGDSKWDSNDTVYIIRLFSNGRSWD